MKFINLNKLLRLRIKSKMIISFIGLSIIPVFIIGILGINSNVRSLRKISIEQLKYTLSETQKELDLFFHSIEENARFFSSSSTFDRFIEAVNSNDSIKINAAIIELHPEIVGFTPKRNIFYQIKFIDNNGDELFVVEKIDGKIRLLEKSELNKTGSKFYLYIAQKTLPNTITFIPTEITERNLNKIIPTVSCIYNVQKSNFSGILVFQIYAENFFNFVSRENAGFSNAKIILVNNGGYYLYHSDKKTNWDQLSASKTTLNLYNDFGDKVAKKILSDTLEIINEQDEYIVAHGKVFNSDFGFNNEYTLLISVLKKEIFKTVNKYKLIFYVLFVFFLILSFLLARLATREFIGPIQKLINEAKILASGDYNARVEINTYDEIEELANQFNSMASSLQQRKIETIHQNELLEQKVIDRTKDLANEKNKLDTIFNNVPFGFILFDKENNILSASKSISKIYEEKSLKILEENHLNLNFNNNNRLDLLQKVKASGGTLSDYSTYEKKNGSKQFLEHIFLPTKSTFPIESVIEIIIDITKRRRLQDLLIHSEKLAATGELAAVIAHEMRNSLTSVRMLLQILSKKEGNSPDDNDSFNVALDSVHRMEGIVNDLLQLAKPAELDLGFENINSIIESGIEFSKTHLLNKQIILKINLGENLPMLFVDKIQFKEIIINIIINAVQAIETSGIIEVTTKATILTREVSDIAKIKVTDSDLEKLNIQEIIFCKGTEVVQIEISDNGSGIDLKNINRIFDPFFTTKVNGTGLGLSFVKNVINQHGAIIKVKNTMKKGCKFTIYFPIK